MADEKKTEQAEAPPAGPSKVVLIISMIVPGLLAGGASFAGSMMGAAQGAAAAAPAPTSSVQANVPGPTVKLAPFVLSVKDDKGGAHPMKVSIAVELAAGSAEADFDSYEPRVRDATIRLLRNLSYDEASNK
ncbi:MAG: flagellar basal body-associated FliL family protein, partial [Myxococcales bacterium]|nr:flagellar basal body-associated FliL family protein [Myxococcales bacterium]